MRELSILKLGGSLITGKGDDGKFREELLREIGSLLARESRGYLIIVHGAGSIGHPLAKEYRLDEGYRSPRHLEGFVKTVNAMRVLNSEVVRVLTEAGLFSIGVPGSLAFQTRNYSIESVDLSKFIAALDMELVPVTCGDVVFDRVRKFAILSGDSMAVELATRLHAKRVIFATDVDGVYKRYGDTSSLIPELKLGDHLRASYAPVDDVTGGMAYKVEVGFEAAKAGAEVLIVNGLHPERIVRALRGERVMATRLVT
ncbi:MAG: isopentenyl phosphate kinase [Aigarchaeota archaeon]|nr:isopentenyl phosphate kinase [Aigarchaeota archaeon]MDW8092567.1 isopentenyl phosphate kinase [Nitrososphaerota archaeon]